MARRRFSQGLIRDTDSDSATNIPGLGDIPILGRLFGDHNTNKEKTEIVLSITPRIIRAKARPSSDTTEFWYGTESRSGRAARRRLLLVRQALSQLS